MRSSVPAASSMRSSSAEPLTASVLQFLHSHDAITNVILTERPPLAARSVAQWETHNGLTLPSDLRSFYALSDGFQLTWSIKMRDSAVPLGHLHINPLSQLRRYKLAMRVRQFDRNLKLVRSSSDSGAPAEDDDDEDAADDDPADDEPFTGNNAPPAPVVPAWPALFDLDSSCTAGRIVLVWSSPTVCAGVHFLDPSLNLYFVAASFAAYYRLLLMHLGIRDWIFAFSEAGMTHQTMQYFHFLSPQRLAIDLAHAQSARAQSSSAATPAPARLPSAASALTSALDTSSSKHAPLNLAKIEELAQSILALTPKPTVRSAHAKSLPADDP